MTVPATEAFVSGPYAGNGVTVLFDYEFRIYADDELTVLRRNADDSSTLLVEGTDYTVNGVGNATGSITLSSATLLPTGATLTITPNITPSQERPFASQSSTSLEEIEAGLDKLTSLTRQFIGTLQRAVVADAGSEGVSVGTLAEGELVQVGAERRLVSAGTTAAALLNSASAAAMSASAAAQSASVAGQREAVAIAAANEAVDALNDMRTYERYYVDDYVTNTTPGTTNCAAGIIAAITAIRNSGRPGRLVFGSEVYAVGSKITVDWPILLEGKARPYFANMYSDNGLVLLGPWISALPGLNDDVVEFVGYNGGGTYPRVHSGAHALGVHGNRSGLQGLTAVDRNSVGSAIRINGASYVYLNDVLTMRAAEHGVSIGGSSNNITLHEVTSLSNAQDGFFIFAGDGKYGAMVAGFNGRDGIRTNAGPLGHFRCWNNVRRGVFVDGSPNVPPVVVSGGAVYDNGGAGVWFGNGEGHVLTGCQVTDNSRSVGSVDNDQGNVAISSSVTGEIGVIGNAIGRVNAGGTPGYGADDTPYGIIATQGAPEVLCEGNVWLGESVGNAENGSPAMQLFNFADPTNLRAHSRTGLTLLRHPGFTATSGIDLDDFTVTDVGGLSFGAGVTLTATTGSTLAVGGSTIVTLNYGVAHTVTTMTSNLPAEDAHLVIVRNIGANGVAFIHNANLLRLDSGGNQTLDPGQAWMFVKVPDANVWQQIGVA